MGHGRGEEGGGNTYQNYLKQKTKQLHYKHQTTPAICLTLPPTFANEILHMNDPQFPVATSVSAADQMLLLLAD